MAQTAETTETFTCCSCDVDITHEALYACRKPNCSKIGEAYCDGCGQSAHKRKNHDFDIEADHIKLITLDMSKQNIKPGSYQINYKTKNDTTPNGETDGCRHLSPHIEDSALVSALMSLNIASQNACIRATAAVNNTSVEEAVEWLFSHLNDTDINEAIQPNIESHPLKQWCLANGFSIDLCHRLQRAPMYIDTLQKLQFLTSDEDINDLVKELGLRFGKKAAFVQAMQKLKDVSPEEKSMDQIHTESKKNTPQPWHCSLCEYTNIAADKHCLMCGKIKKKPNKPKPKPVEDKKEAKIDDSRLRCNRCKEELNDRDWNKQNVIMDKGIFYTHLMCPKLNIKKKKTKLKFKANPKSIITYINKKFANDSFGDMTFAPNPDLTKDEIDGECHIRDGMIPYRTLQKSNFLKLYDSTKAAPKYDDIIHHLPDDLLDGFKECYQTVCSQHSDHIVGRTCVKAWTHENKFAACRFYCKLNAALLSDHSELLKEWMLLIRGLNKFLVNTRPKEKIVCYRKSDLSLAQFKRIEVGKKYRIAMYTATSTNKEFVKQWNRNSGTFYWIFNVPANCYNACCIAEYSYHGEESEVLMPPYSSIQIVSKKADGYITANVLDNKNCSTDLPTIVA